MEILPNLHCVEGKASNIFIWIGENGLALIDAGSPGDAERVLEYIEEIGRRPTEVRAILITHADYDHAGSAAVLQESSKATVYAGTQTAKLLTAGQSPEHMPRLIQFITNRFFKYRPVAEERILLLAEGQRVPDFDDYEVLATPGHCPDHHAFCSSVHGVLFAGDAFNTRGGQLKAGPKRITADEDLARKSAKRLLLLTPAIIACGHGPPMTSHSGDDLMVFYRELDNQVGK
jgi:glyoxylase-like metal-dependent hydrolase (beta-lactamase superfamily II)